MVLPETIWTVRRFPGSRKYPHFNVEPLAHTLGEAGVQYVPFPELGGRRKPLQDSRNTAWRNDAFRGYADYMQTREFAAGIERLASLASNKRTAVMCSEAVWWRCHRGLLADWLKVRGVRVLHILDARHVVEHPWTSAAHVTEGELDYLAGKA